MNAESQRFKTWLIYVCIFSGAVFILESMIVKPWPVIGDAAIYREMAEFPWRYHGGNFGFRILTPSLVYLLPFDIDTGFRIVTLTALWATSITLYLFLCKVLKLGHKLSFLGVLLFDTDFVVLYNISNFRLVDPFNYLFLIANLYFMYKRDDVKLATTMALSMFNKETQFIMVPMYYLTKKKNGIDPTTLWRVTIIALPSLAVYLAIRYSFIGISPIDLRALFYVRSFDNEAALWFGKPIKAMGLLGISYTFLWILAGIGYMRYVPKGISKSLIWLALLVFPQFVGSVDVSRVVAYLFPAIISFSLYTIEGYSITRVRKCLIAGVIVAQIASQFVIAGQLK